MMIHTREKTIDSPIGRTALFCATFYGGEFSSFYGSKSSINYAVGCAYLRDERGKEKEKKKRINITQLNFLGFHLPKEKYK
jgi:hypothetical protein